jgi:hypothetical protein
MQDWGFTVWQAMERGALPGGYGTPVSLWYCTRILGDFRGLFVGITSFSGFFTGFWMFLNDFWADKGILRVVSYPRIRSTGFLIWPPPPPGIQGVQRTPLSMVLDVRFALAPTTSQDGWCPFQIFYPQYGTFYRPKHINRAKITTGRRTKPQSCNWLQIVSGMSQPVKNERFLPAGMTPWLAW